jgi:hypothetical protein
MSMSCGNNADAGAAAGQVLGIALEHDRVPADVAQQMGHQQAAVRTADHQSAPFGHAVRPSLDRNGVDVG